MGMYNRLNLEFDGRIIGSIKIVVLFSYYVYTNIYNDLHLYWDISQCKYKGAEWMMVGIVGSCLQ